MTNKLKKMLLISILILVNSCAPGIPDPPDVLKLTPIWGSDSDGEPFVKYFNGRYLKSGTKVTLSLQQAREIGIVATDLDSEAKAETYLKDMQDLAKKSCDQKLQ